MMHPCECRCHIDDPIYCEGCCEGPKELHAELAALREKCEGWIAEAARALSENEQLRALLARVHEEVDPMNNYASPDDRLRTAHKLLSEDILRIGHVEVRPDPSARDGEWRLDPRRDEAPCCTAADACCTNALGQPIICEHPRDEAPLDDLVSRAHAVWHGDEAPRCTCLPGLLYQERGGHTSVCPAGDGTIGGYWKPVRDEAPYYCPDCGLVRPGHMAGCARDEARGAGECTCPDASPLRDDAIPHVRPCPRAAPPEPAHVCGDRTGTTCPDCDT